MKLLVGVNIALLVGTTYGLVRGFNLSWYISTLPLALIGVGAVLGLVPFRICAGLNAALTIAGGFALWFAAAIAFLGGFLMLLGASQQQIDTAGENAAILFGLGMVAIISGCVASRQLVKTPKSAT